MPNQIEDATNNISASFARAQDRLHAPLSLHDQQYKAGPKHRKKKHDWDFQLHGAPYFWRHARRHFNCGAMMPAATLAAVSLPAAISSVSGIGFVSKVLTATFRWHWYFGYVNPQSEAALRKDLMQFEIQEALAEIQRMATYQAQNPSQRAAMQPFWEIAHKLQEDFEADFSRFGTKIGGSHRLRVKLHHYRRLLKAHAPCSGPMASAGG